MAAQSRQKQESILLKELARDLGFEECRIARAQFLDREAPQLMQWLDEGRHGTMQWMKDRGQMRLNPEELMPGTRSVVVLSFNYYNPENPQPKGAPKVSMYAWGKDYHKVLRKKLRKLVRAFEEATGPVQTRPFTDSAPIMEKAWAVRSGLGWLGKHTNVLSKQHGSWFFLCGFLVDRELEPDAPVADHCGECTRCIDACPTQAITAPYELDARKCLSYLTIEHKGPIPEEFKDNTENWLFGCDICQEVCPWNRFSRPHEEPEFAPLPALKNMTAPAWATLNQAEFQEQFAASPLKRPGLEKLHDTLWNQNDKTKN